MRDENLMKRSKRSEGLLLLLTMTVALPAMLLGPIMMAWPAFLGLQWFTAGTVLSSHPPTTVDWALSPLVSAAGVLLTYAAFRITIELNRDVDAERRGDMSNGYLNALESGELQGAVHLAKRVTSREMVLSALLEAVPGSRKEERDG